MVESVKESHAPILARLASRLWDSHGTEALEGEILAAIQGGNTGFFIKYAMNLPVAFAQCSLRKDYVEGTNSSPVGYLEGIFVEAAHRNKGYGRELIQACQAWARQMGCKEFASDCQLDNEESLRFHRAVGFEEANRIICFRMNL